MQYSALATNSFAQFRQYIESPYRSGYNLRKRAIYSTASGKSKQIWDEEETRSQKLEIRKQKLEDRNWKIETGE
jgi:hypothetical protein